MMAELKTNIEVIKADFMYKESKHIRQFKKRWITLTNEHKLFTFKPKEIYKEYTEVFDLNVYDKVIITSDDKFEFKIYSTDTNISRRFRCNDTDGLNSWVKEIKQTYQKICNKDMYIHNIVADEITCPYVIKNDDVNQKISCPIYYAMMNKYEFTVNNLYHLNQYKHFRDEYKDKPACTYGQKCYKFVRLEKGGNKLEDACHLKLFRHPPRTRQIELSQNINPLIINTISTKNSQVYTPDNDGKLKYKFNEKDGYLIALIEEVISNGFENDLYLNQDDIKDNKDNNILKYTILHLVDDKLKHIRHKTMGSPLRKDHMLALILYTGCHCNYDLCAQQRDGNYETWEWFDYCLYEAICVLDKHETGCYKLYTGIDKVKLNKQNIQSAYFVTYVSTTWIKEITTTFVGDKGMIIEISKEFRDKFICCDVSWISKFPDECEVLIARSTYGSLDNNFALSIKDEQSGIQTVSMHKSILQKPCSEAKPYMKIGNRCPNCGAIGEELHFCDILSIVRVHMGTTTPVPLH